MVWRSPRFAAWPCARGPSGHVEAAKDLGWQGMRPAETPVGLGRGVDKKRQPPSPPLVQRGLRFHRSRGPPRPAGSPAMTNPFLFPLTEDRAAINRLRLLTNGRQLQAICTRSWHARGAGVPVWGFQPLGQPRPAPDRAADFAGVNGAGPRSRGFRHGQCIHRQHRNSLRDPCRARLAHWGALSGPVVHGGMARQTPPCLPLRSPLT